MYACESLYIYMVNIYFHDYPKVSQCHVLSYDTFQILVIVFQLEDYDLDFEVIWPSY